jgi:hypothetical protein
LVVKSKQINTLNKINVMKALELTKRLELLIQAANMGQDFASGNASTVKYDSIEDMILDSFGKCGHCDNIQILGDDCHVCGWAVYKLQ